MKRSKICLITTPEGKPKENGKQVIFEGITATSPATEKHKSNKIYTKLDKEIHKLTV